MMVVMVYLYVFRIRGTYRMRLASSCVRGIVKEISQCLVRLKVVNKTFGTTNNDHPVCYLRNYHSRIGLPNQTRNI